MSREIKQNNLSESLGNILKESEIPFVDDENVESVTDDIKCNGKGSLADRKNIQNLKLNIPKKLNDSKVPQDAHIEIM